eukprot:355986-Chlamydomonas_euryale.AAC.7
MPYIIICGKHSFAYLHAHDSTAQPPRSFQLTSLQVVLHQHIIPAPAPPLHTHLALQALPHAAQLAHRQAVLRQHALHLGLRLVQISQQQLGVLVQRCVARLLRLRVQFTAVAVAAILLSCGRPTHQRSTRERASERASGWPGALVRRKSALGRSRYERTATPLVIPSNKHGHGRTGSTPRVEAAGRHHLRAQRTTWRRALNARCRRKRPAGL